MPAFLVTLATAAFAGGFSVYPWGGDSIGRMVIASILWLAGTSLAIRAGYLEYKRPKGAHRPPVDPRESLKQMLIDTWEKGEAIHHDAKFVADMERSAPPWQTSAVALLRDSLVSDCWREFEQMGPKSGHKLDNQLWDCGRSCN